ncbi:THUMP-like domain-containing protein [Corynebacterium sp. p3-SID1194]|uniref:THUMP-like domain-containing protein n=1 Tax=Corynebacterium sp. p3-SID1194 TaxID=2916105 RepID=UPI0021A58848|nr:SAM-dependent methyltransferase [Corynebacterium sp. p3-SID1194]MCT1450797.1 SAM-dependent methyltransferase [Corynebacterium sp. p3-SID1194]
MSFSPAEIRFLSAHRDDIARVAASGEVALTKKSAIADRTVLSKLFDDHARAVMELLQARQTLAPKLAGPAADWMADSDSAQQATPFAVSQVRAGRIAAAGASLVHDVTCSIGTEAPAVTAAGMDWLGTDIDYSRLLMARENVGGGAAAGRAWVAQADALAPVTTPASSPGPRIRACSGTGSRPGRVIVADPARRADGRRITDPAKLIPPLPDLIAAYPGAAMAIKCAPGIDYADWHGLVSVVSVNGGVKEACLYTPDLADPGHTREAVVIRESFTERVEDCGDGVDVDKPKSFIVEPDGAVIRAGLVQQWAARHGLTMLDPHIAFLTGDAVPDGYSGFPFIEAVPLKKLRAALKAHGAGSLEILVRGVDVDPDQLRAKLKLKGDRPMGVAIARIGDHATAFICGARVR